MTQKNMSLNVRLMSVPFWINTWKKIFILIFIILFIIKNIIVTEIHDWDSNTSLDLKVYIKPNQKSYIVQPKLSKISNLKMNILLIVSSHPKHFAHRDAIRSTWGNNFNNLHTIQPKLHGQIIFQIGLDPKSFGIDRLVQEESVQYGDILIQDFIEHYNNLTIKTIMLLKYLNHLAVIPSFIFKADDDIFLNVKNLIQKFPKKQHYEQISGYLYKDAYPHRWAFSILNQNWKWICPYWMYSNDTYPSFTQGFGYIIPGKFIPCLYNTALKTNQIIYEDVFLTGIVAQSCGHQRNHMPGFHRYFVDPCEESEPVILIHNVKPKDQYYLYSLSHSGPERC